MGDERRIQEKSVSAFLFVYNLVTFAAQEEKKKTRDNQPPFVLEVSNGRKGITHRFRLSLVCTFFTRSIEVRNRRRIGHEILQFLGIRRSGEDGSELVDRERSLNERSG